ncbi:hypothetical protein [cf. Phormidesmis sp. LEGE 11477]|uniref:hypothetical protein n=1 Tax=cf. Phormidesmis sp. LEGE 11477 TaxID=1828680 RepID=UPI00188239E6|nr:hypothetical protein [cf. Phormidesmis sp. LEGE 11477]MBE9061876.1 hypothetical protein [cf. Phormidesmis sp. LEGE 11477]
MAKNTTQFIALGFDEIFRLEADGSGSLIGNSGFGGNSLASDSIGDLFTIAGPLVKIDPETGVGVSNTQFGVGDVRALAFSNADELFAISQPPSSAFELFELNIETGQQTLINRIIGANAVQGLDFAPDGTLYGWDLSLGLITINPQTGEATDVNSAVGANAAIQSITVTDDGRLFGARDALYEIDIETGEATFVGEGDYDDIRGIEAFKTVDGQPLQFLANRAGGVFRIEADGSGFFVENNGFGGNSLASNSADEFFTISGLPNGVRPLVEIDPNTGLAGLAGDFTDLDVRGLAFSPEDRLFAVQFSSEPPDGDELFKLDPKTGERTLVGVTQGFSGIQGLDFSPEGTLYGWDISEGLVIIDPDTAATTDVNPSVGADAGIQSIVFTEDGSLFGARDALYQIDVETGETTFIGEGDYDDLRGIEVLKLVNELNGTRDDDRLIGSSKNDIINGFGGDDRLVGKAGDDTLNGGGGRDNLRGAGGDDVLIGGNGFDLLTGNQGRDIFVLELNQGRDIIRDFKNGVDSLGLSDGLSFGDLNIVGRGDSTLIRFNNATLVSLSGISAHTIGAEDFVLFS